MKLSGLSPDTKYYYAVGSSGAVLAGDDARHFFVTAPGPGTQKSVRIWVLGDSGTADPNAQSVRNAYFQYIGSDRTDVWLMLGDNAYPNGSDSSHQDAVFDMYPSMLRQTVLWTTIGNHDTLYTGSTTQAGPYFDIFTLPRRGEAGGVASGSEAFYSFDYANIHFICLDSYGTDRSRAGAMMRWLETDLAATTQEWIIAFWHHPPYSKGSHDSDPDRRPTDMRENALPILESYGVDLVLCGHSHSYERSFQLRGHYGTSDTLIPSMIVDGSDGRSQGPYQASKGTVYVVLGSSGKLRPGPLNHPAMYTSQMQLGSMALDIKGDRLEARFIKDGGSVRDHFIIVKDGAQSHGPVLFTERDQVAAVESVGPQTLEIPVTHSADDAEEDSSGNVDPGSSDLELVYDEGLQTVGLRFTDVSIPRGATIEHAHIQFQVDEENSGDTSLTITGEARGDAPAFVSKYRDISSRAKTRASVSWSPAPWTALDQAGPDQCTSDISSVIQEVVDRSDWLSGNALVFIITGDGERTAVSYDWNPGSAPVLHVTYTASP